MPASPRTAPRGRAPPSGDRVLYYTILYHTIYFTIPYYTILYYTIPYYTIPYYTILDRCCSQLLAGGVKAWWIYKNTKKNKNVVSSPLRPMDFLALGPPGSCGVRWQTQQIRATHHIQGQRSGRHAARTPLLVEARRKRRERHSVGALEREIKSSPNQSSVVVTTCLALAATVAVVHNVIQVIITIQRTTYKTTSMYK